MTSRIAWQAGRRQAPPYPLRFLLASILLFPVFPLAQPCQDYACDSAAVRAILDANALGGVSVAEVTLQSDGRITSLSLEYRGLDTLPPALGRLASLQRLRLDRNDLTELPPEIGELRALEHLLLDNNRLKSLPREIGSLTSLTTLIAFTNILDSVPETLGNLSALTWLRLEDNRLTGLPASILSLPPTVEFGIAGNRICSPPDSVAAWIDAASGGPDWRWSQTTDGEAPCVPATADKLVETRPDFVEIYPDPDRRRLRFRFQGGGANTLRIYDHRGRLLGSWAGSQSEGEVDMAAAGPYWIRAATGKRVLALRMGL